MFDALSFISESRLCGCLLDRERNFGNGSTSERSTRHALAASPPVVIRTRWVSWMGLGGSSIRMWWIWVLLMFLWLWPFIPFLKNTIKCLKCIRIYDFNELYPNRIDAMILLTSIFIISCIICFIFITLLLLLYISI